jgi:small subunit ribosomal protein S1
VLDVDLDRERVSLSLKATQEDPWRQFARSHQIGELIPGRVTKLVPFGAFVRVDDGIEGLVHISELAERHVDIPEQVVSVGEEITVKIIDIDLDRRRISLSLKQAAAEQPQAAVAEDEMVLEEDGTYATGYVDENGNYVEAQYAEGEYDQQYYTGDESNLVYDEAGNAIGVLPDTEMAAAFQQAGFYDASATYEEGAEPPAAEGETAEATPDAAAEATPEAAPEAAAPADVPTPADVPGGAPASDESLEDIVEDLKRRGNSPE